MARQSISFTKPNDEWLKAQVNTEEYSSKSELVNDLIRQARRQQREVDWVRSKLVRSEKRLESEGHREKSADKLLSEFKERARKDGRL